MQNLDLNCHCIQQTNNCKTSHQNLKFYKCIDTQMRRLYHIGFYPAPKGRFLTLRSSLFIMLTYFMWPHLVIPMTDTILT